MGQYYFARCRLSSPSVVVVVCNAAGRWARGRSGGRHCTAGQYGYVPLGRHLFWCACGRVVGLKCYVNPCENGGTCHEVFPNRSVKCECFPAFRGNRCEQSQSVLLFLFIYLNGSQLHTLTKHSWLPYIQVTTRYQGKALTDTFKGKNAQLHNSR